MKKTGIHPENGVYFFKEHGNIHGWSNGNGKLIRVTRIEGSLIRHSFIEEEVIQGRFQSGFISDIRSIETDVINIKRMLKNEKNKKLYIIGLNFK